MNKKFDENIEYLEEEMKKKVLVDYETVPGVINFDLLRNALRQFHPEGKISKAIADEGDFENCTRIEIEFYNILKIDFLWIMPNLRVLSLANNLIEEIERLDTLVNLVELNLSFNKLEKIKNMNTLVNLEVLNLYGNKISKIENLDEMTKLKLFSIGSNKISNLECVKYLRDFKQLKSLCLCETPLERNNEYCKEIVSALLPQLVYYNYSIIRNEERCFGRSLNFEMIAEIEEKEREEEETKVANEDKVKRREYLRRAMIEGYDENEFFEFLMVDDMNYNAIRTVGEDTIDIFNDYQEKLYNYSAKIRTIGEDFLKLREQEVERFEKGTKACEKICSDMVEQILGELRMKRREWKKELLDLYSINADYPDHELHRALLRSQEIKLLYADLIKHSWFKLMDLEMKRFEYAGETNTKYELALKEIINKEVEAFQGIFTDIRETENQFKNAIYDVMNKIVTDFHARRENSGTMPGDLKLMFAEPESLSNFIKVSYEQHLYLLDCLEDRLMLQLTEWQEQKIGHLAKRENERNREAVYRMNRFLDNQINYFEELTKPLLKQCQELLTEGYVDEIKDKIYKAAYEL